MISRGVALALDFQRDIRASAYTATAVWEWIHATGRRIEIRNGYRYHSRRAPHPRESTIVSGLKLMFTRH